MEDRKCSKCGGNGPFPKYGGRRCNICLAEIQRDRYHNNPVYANVRRSQARSRQSNLFVLHIAMPSMEERKSILRMTPQDRLDILLASIEKKGS